MYGKLVCILILAAAMLVHDIPKFRRGSRRDQIVYGSLVAALLYLAVIFVLSKSWPNLDTIFNSILLPAKQIVKWLNPASAS